MHCCVCDWISLWDEVCGCASGYLCLWHLLIFLCRNAVDGTLDAGVWEGSEKEMLAQGLLLTLWPQGQDLGPLAHGNANSGLVATWRGRPPHHCNEISPQWWLLAGRSWPEGQGFSHHCYPAPGPSTTYTPNTPPNTPPLLHDIIAHAVMESGGQAELLTADTRWVQPEYLPVFSDEKSQMTARFHCSHLTPLITVDWKGHCTSKLQEPSQIQKAHQSFYKMQHTCTAHATVWFDVFTQIHTVHANSHNTMDSRPRASQDKTKMFM